MKRRRSAAKALVWVGIRDAHPRRASRGLPQQKNENKQNAAKQQNFLGMATLLHEWLPNARGFRDLEGESRERLLAIALKALTRCDVRIATPRWSKHGGASRRARRVWQP